MSNPSDPPTDEAADSPADEAPSDGPAGEADDPADTGPEPVDETDRSDEELEALRQQVEEKYDFDDFGPDQLAEMSPEEWDAAFDPDSWITGEELLDRVERDLKNEIAVRNVFARVERLADGKIIAYSDQGYATVFPDGSVEGVGTVLRDVKPTVALCSMESYDVPEMPDSAELPEPTEVPEGSGELGNLMLQIVGGIQILAGLVLLGAWIVTSLNVVGLMAGLGFLTIGLILFLVVANARLSDRFRAEEYRNRLRAVGLEEGERPDFLPVEDDQWVGDGPADQVGDDSPDEQGDGGPEDDRVEDRPDEESEPETAS